MQAQITNACSHEIFVILTPSYDKTVPEAPKLGIPSGSTQAYRVNTGTMNLLLWTQREGPPVWQGPVPTLIRKPLLVSDDGVFYDGMKLPSSSEITESPGGRSWIWWIIILLVILCAVYWLLRKKAP